MRTICLSFGQAYEKIIIFSLRYFSHDENSIFCDEKTRKYGKNNEVLAQLTGAKTINLFDRKTQRIYTNTTKMHYSRNNFLMRWFVSSVCRSLSSKEIGDGWYILRSKRLFSMASTNVVTINILRKHGLVFQHFERIAAQGTGYNTRFAELVPFTKFAVDIFSDGMYS